MKINLAQNSVLAQRFMRLSGQANQFFVERNCRSGFICARIVATALSRLRKRARSAEAPTYRSAGVASSDLLVFVKSLETQPVVSLHGSFHCVKLSVCPGWHLDYALVCSVKGGEPCRLA